MKFVKMASTMALALLLIGLLAAPASAKLWGSSKSDTAGEGKAKIGEPAPSFTLSDSSGRTYNLSDFRGKNVVLIWTDPNCPTVQRIEREGVISDLARKYDPSKTVFLQVDSSGSAGTAKESSTMSSGSSSAGAIVTLSDRDQAVAKTYGAKRTPEAFVIDSNGKLVYRGAIDNDAKGSKSMSERTNYVDQTLASLQSNGTPKTQHTRPYGCKIKHEGTGMFGTHQGSSQPSSSMPSSSSSQPGQPSSSGSSSGSSSSGY